MSDEKVKPSTPVHKTGDARGVTILPKGNYTFKDGHLTPVPPQETPKKPTGSGD